MSDFFDSMLTLERRPDKREAEQLRDEMLASDFDSLSSRDAIEFFTCLLRVDELFPGVILERPTELLAKIASDHRRGYRQDQISKAAVLEKLGDVAQTSELVAIAQDPKQDLDTRNIAIHLAWNRPSASDAEVVALVRTFLNELIPQALNRDEPAFAFAVGLAYRLLLNRQRSAEDEATFSRYAAAR